MMSSAVLDACVLYPAPLRDLLLRLAENNVIVPFWSDEIRNEWMGNLLRKRPDLQREKLERTCREMDSHFPRSLVRGYESIVSTLTLPDSQDRHVLAVALHAKAKYIVTFNLDDFPKMVLEPYKIDAVSTDEFVLRLIQQAPAPVLRAVKNHRLRLTRPAKTVDEYLATLEKQGLPKTVAFLREHEGEI